LVRDYESGSQSQRAFCAERGVGQSSLRYWKRRLEQAGAGEALPPAMGLRLVPVKLLEEAPASADSGLVVVTSRGVRVEIAREFDTATLRRVLAAVEEA
jgi:hypothetical protein